MTQLVKIEAARMALTAAVNFDEVMAVHDVAKQAELYARLAKDTELIEKATEIKVRAERKAGEMLRVGRESGDRAKSGGDFKKESPPPTLSDIGITKDQSSRWQSLASMSDDHFETAVATAKDTAGQVTTAFMLREASKNKPQGKPKTGPKADAMREELKAAQERGISMLETYLRLTIKAVREQDSFTDQERALIGELMGALTAMTV